MKKVIVTGAAAGIGRAIVDECRLKGYYTIACDIDGVSLAAIKERPDFDGLTFELDVSDYGAVKDFFTQLGAVDRDDEYSLINNAGIYYGKSLLSYDEAEIGRVLDVNIKGAVYCSKFFAEMLLRATAKGRIVNISSVAGQEGSSDAVYGSSKAALLGLTKSCAMNFAPNILVNAVTPTVVDTAMMGNIPKWRLKEYGETNLIKEDVTPGDVADTVMFLLSDKASHYTGATFDLNNGGYLR